MVYHESRAFRSQPSFHLSYFVATTILSYLAHSSVAHPFSTSVTTTTNTPSTPAHLNPTPTPTSTSHLSAEDLQTPTPTPHHNALETTSTTKIFVAVFFGVCILFCVCLILAYRFGSFARLCCLSRVDKRDERRRRLHHREERDRETRQREQLQSQSRTEGVVGKWRAEREEVGGQGERGGMDTRKDSSGDIADGAEEEEELPSYGSVVGDGRVASRGDV